MSAQERSDLIETRADMARAILDILLMAMDADSGPTQDVIVRTISAAHELLSVE